MTAELRTEPATAEEALAVLHEVVKREGLETRRNCQYTAPASEGAPDGALVPHCIAAHALIELRAASMRELEHGEGLKIASRDTPWSSRLSSGARDVIAAAQKRQDRGDTWGEALSDAWKKALSDAFVAADLDRDGKT